MKKIYIQKQIIGWEEYTYEVPDDFEDYESLLDDSCWTDWEYLVDGSVGTGEYKIFNEDYDRI